MSIRSVLATILSPPTPDAAQTDKRNEVSTGFFSSKRFLLVIAFGVLVALNMLPAALFHDVTLVLMTYIIGESLTNAFTVAMNGWIKVHEVKTDIAYEQLAAAKLTTASGSITVNPLPAGIQITTSP